MTNGISRKDSSIGGRDGEGQGGNSSYPRFSLPQNFLTLNFLLQNFPKVVFLGSILRQKKDMSKKCTSKKDLSFLDNQELPLYMEEI